MRYPDYALFREVCGSGLAVVRPLAGSPTANPVDPWDFGGGWPPSYLAFGRLRAMLAIDEALALHPRRVLEVAAGDAALCAVLRQQGCEVFANDLREEHLKLAVGHFKNGDQIKLVAGNLFDLSADRVGRFDLIIACEVIEHVAHSVDFLVHLRSLLAERGRILLTTPNGSYIRNRLPTYSEVEDFDALELGQFKPDADGHLFLITPAEMRKLAAEAGLRVEKLDLWGTPVITGHCQFRLLSSAVPLRACYALERFGAALPTSIAQKICYAMSVVLAE